MTTISKFELHNCIATGTVSQVWEVVEQGTSKQFAMKLLLPEALTEKEQKAVLRHEFKVGKSLEHPNIIRFYELEVSRDHAFLLMDYFRAPSLKAQTASNLAQTQARFKTVSEAMTLALTYMHEKGWLHRDIKPENILLNNGGESRLIDFSLSSRAKKGMGKMLAGKAKSIKGTRTYIAPETLLKKQPTEQTDIYSLGITLYEVLTGAPPFAGTSPNELCIKHLSEKPVPPSVINPNVTPEADIVILKMLAKKPPDRQESMQELYSQFRTLKVWHSEPMELAEQKRKSEELAATMSVDQRLDSRADAKRREMGIESPSRKKKKKPKILLKDVQAQEAEEKAQNAPTPPQPMPQQPMYPTQPMYPPQQPMYMPPPMAPPAYPQPMQPAGQMQIPPQQMPPQIPLQAIPPQPTAPQPVVHPQQVPVEPQPTTQQPAVPPETESPIGSPLRRAVPKPAPEPKATDEDLDFFTSIDDLQME